MPHVFTGPKEMGANLEACHATAQHALGHVVEGRDAAGLAARYRYVQFLDAIAYVAGHVVVMASATTFAVTGKKAGGSALAGLEPVGIVFQATPPTQNQYGWVQISGIATVLITWAAVIAGDRLVVDEKVDGASRELVYTTYAAAQARNVGTALATIADTAPGKVLLTLPSVA